MLRRILLLVTVAAVMLTMSVAPAFAGLSTNCQNQKGIVASGGKAFKGCKASRGPIAFVAASMFPGTGGATPIAPIAAAMLLGTGVVALAVTRRR